MATATKINDFVEDLIDGLHDFDAHSFKIALTNTAPAAESSDPTADGNGVLANITEISYSNYSDDLAVDRTLESVTTALSSGTATVDAANFTITASGGDMAAFRYVYLYNDTASGDPLIAVWDLGSAVTLTNGQSLPINISGSGLLTLA